MMKGLTVAVIACLAAHAHARVVILSAEAAFHTDGWCQDHHIGEGPSTCIQHSGCCYDGRIGKCHSCDAHSDEWCGAYGGSDAKACTGFAGCTMSYGKNEDGGTSKDGICVAAADDSVIIDDVTCEMMLEAMTECHEAPSANDYCMMANPKREDGSLVPTFKPGCEAPMAMQVKNEPKKWICSPIPQCTADGEFEPEQRDDDGFVWCAAENGHMIPDTRMKEKAFANSLMNCAKERKKHAGMQCPNAVTLATGNGEVMINDHEDVGNCDMRCNTDKDCGDEEWCCYNGCGYSCQVPIIPKADCSQLSLDASLTASDLTVTEGPGTHGTIVTIECAEGYGGSEPVEINCKHGSWSEDANAAMDCKKDCPPYEIKDARKRDYEVIGRSVIHGAKRKIACVNGYGAVAGSPDAMRFYKEKIECINGAWEERTLECSSCFDAPSEGPNAFWTGRELQWQFIDHDGDEGGSLTTEEACKHANGVHCVGEQTLMDYQSNPIDTAVRDEEGNVIEPAGGDIDKTGPREEYGFTSRLRKLVDVGTRRADSFDCLYFASRPMKCSEFADARNACRISCRTCEQALMKYKVKAIADTKDHTKHPEKWLKRKLRLLSHFKNLITEQRRTKVAKRVKKGVDDLDFN